jgi:hypothetical protein
MILMRVVQRSGWNLRREFAHNEASAAVSSEVFWPWHANHGFCKPVRRGQEILNKLIERRNYFIAGFTARATLRRNRSVHR